MAPKRSRQAAGPSRHPTYDESRFAFELAEDDFHVKATKSFLQEIQVDRAALRAERIDMYEEIRRREMEFLFHDPASVNKTLVREFYANCSFHLNREVIVRGKIVNAQVQTIRQVLRLPPFTSDIDYYHDRPNVTWEVMIAALCTGGRPIWIEDQITLNSSCFTHLAKCWLTVICSRFLPSSNTTDVNFNRALLIWCFVTKKDFDPARIIGDEMVLRGPLRTKGFYFPSLVTTLCLMKHTPTFPADGELPQKAPFKASGIRVGRGVRTTINIDDDDDDPVPLAPSRRSLDSVGPSRYSNSGAGISRSQSTRPILRSMEKEVADLRSSVDGLHIRLDAMSQRQSRSENRFMAWLRAFGRACHVDPSTVSDSD